jgi:hypothetical protein
MKNKQTIQKRKLQKVAPQKKDLFERIDRGIRYGIAKELLRHKKAGTSIVISENGKIIKIPPEKIKIPKEFKYLENNTDE